MFQIIFSVRLVFTESYNRIRFEYLREWLLVLERRFLLKNVHCNLTGLSAMGWILASSLLSFLFIAQTI